MLTTGDLIPAAARVWVTATDGPSTLAQALPDEGLALLCFYPFDWSPT